MVTSVARAGKFDKRSGRGILRQQEHTEVLGFKEWAAGEAEAHRFVESLLETAKRSDKFALTEDELAKMKAILKVYPDILNSGRKVQYIGGKRKRPDLEYLDRKKYRNWG